MGVPFCSTLFPLHVPIKSVSIFLPKELYSPVTCRRFALFSRAQQLMAKKAAKAAATTSRDTMAAKGQQGYKRPAKAAAMAKKAAKAAPKDRYDNRTTSSESDEAAATAAGIHYNAAEVAAKAKVAKASESATRALGKWMRANMPMKAKKADIRVPLIEFMNRVDNCDITDMDKRVNLLLRNLTEAGLTIVVCPTRS